MKKVMQMPDSVVTIIIMASLLGIGALLGGVVVRYYYHKKYGPILGYIACSYNFDGGLE